MVQERLPSARILSAWRSIFRWSADEPVRPALMLAGALGMGIPLVISGVWNAIAIGAVMAMSCLTVSNLSVDTEPKYQFPALEYVLIADSLAFLSGSLFGNGSWTAGICIVIITALITLVGGMNRALAQYSSVALIFLIIGSTFPAPTLFSSIAYAGIFLAGENWAVLLIVLITYLFQRYTSRKNEDPTVQEHKGLSPLLLHYERWKRSLRTLKGWKYTFRLTLCMIVAEGVIILWDPPSSYWIALVVILVMNRNLDTTISRIAPRAIGTYFGVLIAGLLFFWSLPLSLLILVISISAGLRIYLKTRNYFLYSALMSVLVITLLEIRDPLASGMMIYRVINTCIGLGITVVMGYLLWNVSSIRPVKKTG
jgi:hypothetical protein